MILRLRKRDPTIVQGSLPLDLSNMWRTKAADRAKRRAFDIVELMDKFKHLDHGMAEIYLDDAGGDLKRACIKAAEAQWEQLNNRGLMAGYFAQTDDCPFKAYMLYTKDKNFQDELCKATTVPREVDGTSQDEVTVKT